MKNLIRIILVLLICMSCAQARKKAWYIKDVSAEKRIWRWCHKNLDKVELHEKGICYKLNRCYKTLFKEKCEVKQLFCSYGDIKCLRLNKWPNVSKG